jgi:hypothetical protein
MDGKGQLRETSADGAVLRWPGRVLTARDLRHSWNGHQELVLLPGTVITPLAAEELRDNAVRVTRQVKEPTRVASVPWGYAEDRPGALVRSAVQALGREGLLLRELPPDKRGLPCRWARAVADCVAHGECRGGVVFCDDPGLVCCVANKLAGLRAVAVCTVGQAAKAARSLGSNLVAVEMPGRTFFEVRQILRTICTAGEPACPAGVACTLGELDGHAHR